MCVGCGCHHMCLLSVFGKKYLLCIISFHNAVNTCVIAFACQFSMERNWKHKFGCYIVNWSEVQNFVKVVGVLRICRTVLRSDTVTNDTPNQFVTNWQHPSPWYMGVYSAGHNTAQHLDQNPLSQFELANFVYVSMCDLLLVSLQRFTTEHGQIN